MSKTFEKLSGYLEKAMAIQASMVLFEWDNETLTPKEAAPFTSKVIGSLSAQYMEIMISEEVKELVDACRNEQGLTEAEQAIVREAAEEIEKLQCIPPREYREFAELTSKATRIWAEAKKEKNFKKFAPVLKDIVGYQKKFASYRAKDRKSVV